MSPSVSTNVPSHTARYVPHASSRVSPSEKIINERARRTVFRSNYRRQAARFFACRSRLIATRVNHASQSDDRERRHRRVILRAKFESP